VSSVGWDSCHVIRLLVLVGMLLFAKLNGLQRLCFLRYTGPTFVNYNAVLQAFTKVEFMIKQSKDLSEDNKFVTTLHTINSSFIKLSKVQAAQTVYRGIADPNKDSNHNQAWMQQSLSSHCCFNRIASDHAQAFWAQTPLWFQP